MSLYTPSFKAFKISNVAQFTKSRSFSTSNLRTTLDNVSKQLNLQELSDWYKVESKVIDSSNRTSYFNSTSKTLDLKNILPVNSSHPHILITIGFHGNSITLPFLIPTGNPLQTRRNSSNGQPMSCKYLISPIGTKLQMMYIFQ